MINIVQVVVMYQECFSYFHPVYEKCKTARNLSHSSSVNNITLEQTETMETFLVKFEKWVSCCNCYLSIEKENVQGKIKAVEFVIIFYSSTSGNLPWIYL